MITNIEAASKSSRKARNSAARLAAVQAVYQMLANDQKASAVIEDFMASRLGKPVDGIDMVMPDGILFKNIVEGVAARQDDLETILTGASAARKGTEDASLPAKSEPLLLSLLLCGAFELLAHHETDAPIIISDYLHVSHAFFDQGEDRLVNGLLDQVKKSVRD